MFDGVDNERDDEPDVVRRQVILTVRAVIDVPVGLDEAGVQSLINNTCKSDFIMALAEEISYDDESGACHICELSSAKLVPVEEEVESEWLDNLGEHADEEED